MRKLLASLTVLLVLLLAADRIGAYAAGTAIGGRLRTSAGLQRVPSVHITGFPFLTQAIGGRYARIDVQADGLDRGGVRISKATASLYGVQVPLSAVLRQSVTSVPVERLSARAVIAFVDLASRGGDRSFTFASDGDRLRVTGRITVLGKTLSAGTTSTVRLAGRTLIITGKTVSVDGQQVGGAVGDAIAGALDLRVPIGRLPYDLSLTGVHVEPGGVVVTATSGPTVLTNH